MSQGLPVVETKSLSPKKPARFYCRAVDHAVTKLANSSCHTSELTPPRGRPLRVLTLCYEWPPLGGGGGRVAASVAGLLTDRGHAVEVITAGMEHLPALAANPYPIRRIACGRRREDRCSMLEMAFYCGAAWLPTLRRAHRWEPDLIHAHFAVPTGLLAWSIAQFTGIPYVLTAHLGDVPGGVEETETAFAFLHPLVARIWRDAAATTAVSPFVAELSDAAYGVRPVVIANPAPTALRTSLNAIPLESPVPLVFLGRFTEQKDPLLLLHALAPLRHLSWTLCMAGDGPLRCDARALATRLNLDDRVTFPGWIGAVEAHRLLNTAAVLCMPSRSEGLPMVAIEAISAGCALVCSAIPGMRGVAVGGGNAWLFPPGSIRDATDCLATAIGNRADMERRRMESLLIAKAFEAPAIVAAYEALFYKAC